MPTRVIACLLFIATCSAPLAALAPFSTAAQERLRDHLQTLDRRLHDRLERTERAAVAGAATDRAEREGAALRRHLADLDAKVRRGEFGDPALWLDRLQALDRLAVELERAAGLDPAPAAARAAARRSLAPVLAPRPKTGELAANDTCDTASPIGLSPVVGTTVGAGAEGGALCGFSELSPDVWHRFRAPVEGFFFATSLGSDFDTVLSVLDACPSAGGEELVCNDNGLGLQSSLGFFAEAGRDYYLRVSGFVGAAGDYRLSVGAGGVVTGTVRDAATGQPLPFVDVELLSIEGFGFASGRTDATGTYRINGVAPGRYGALAAASSSYVARVYGGDSCARNDCDTSQGTPIGVDAGSVVTGIDFALDRGGQVTGSVRDAVTGEPIRFAGVTLWRKDDPSRLVASTSSDETGEFRVDGLPASALVASAEAFGYLGELYSELPCFGNCNRSAGRTIDVALGGVRSGVDFTLERGGTLSGRVTDAITGEPLAFADVVIYDLDGDFFGSGSAEFNGNYTLEGLAPGSYFVAAATFDAHFAEVYDGVPCPTEELFGCDPTAGRQVVVRSNRTTTGIDFALDPKGSIAGRVVDAATGQPIAGASLQAQPLDGGFGNSAASDANGNYRIEGLDAGAFQVEAYVEGYRAEVYDDVACTPNTFGGFDCPTAGTTAVAVGRSEAVGGIDFDLAFLGVIEGRVVETGSGQPIFDATVDVFTTDRRLLRSASTNENGTYRVLGLAAGGYRVVASAFDFQAELYDGLPCPNLVCDIAAGRNVQVRDGLTTRDVDFSLTTLGTVAGRITDRATGAALVSVRVLLRNVDGSAIDSSFTDDAGRYRFETVEPGRYLVWAQADEPYLPELYDGVPCLDLASPRCDTAAAEQVVVVLGATTDNVDFALSTGATISGSVRAQVGGQAITGVSVFIWNDLGASVRSVPTDQNGRWVASGLPAGRYFATADGAFEFADELYRELPCTEFSCNPTSGAPIDLATGASRSGVDFTLSRAGRITGRVIDARSGHGLGDVSVEVWAASGAFVGSALTDADGGYQVSGLRQGPHTVTVRGPQSFVDQVYPGLPCPRGACNPTTGQALAIALDVTISGIDFVLEPGAAITGTVSDAFRHQPIDFVGLELANEQGEPILFELSDAEGRWAFVGLLPGTYFVSTSSFGQYRDEVWTGVVCGSTCSPAMGTPIVVDRLGAIVGAIDFDLLPLRGQGCDPDAPQLCLNENRFKVTARWRDFTGAGARAEGEPLTDDSGYFYFFDPDNVEVVVKVLDACALPDPRFWVFAAGLTNVEVELEVEDTLSGQIKTYQNALGEAFRPILDTVGFATCVPSTASATGPSTAPSRTPLVLEKEGGCTSDGLGLCLNDGRFRVEAFFETFEGTAGQAQAIELTADSGYFWFFDPDNVEVVVKVLDACTAAEPRFWVFAAGLTNVEVTLRVTDTETGLVREYRNPLATSFRPILDTGAFATCP